MAADCIGNFNGRHIAYVGEGYGACTADGQLRETLAQCSREIAWIWISFLLGVHD